VLRSRLAVLLLAAALVGCSDAPPPSDGRTTPHPAASGPAQELVTPAGTRYTSTDLTLPGGDALILAPTDLAPRADAVLVIAAHGAGGSEQTINGPQLGTTRDALLDRGWIVASAMAADRGWGNEASLRDYRALAGRVAERWTVTDVLLHGQSMGAVPAVLLYADRRIPDIRAAALVAPALSLEAVYGRGFADDLEQAYGFRGSSELTAATAGHDPVRLDPALLANARIRIWASRHDNLTPKAHHADVFARRMGPSVEVVEVQGDHFGPDHHRPGELIAFYEAALTRTATATPIRRIPSSTASR
jgi:hypothetical protein